MQLQPWEDRLASVRTEAEVVDVANEFLMSLDHFETMQMPMACKPRKLCSPHDVMAYAFDLLQYRGPEDEAVNAVIHPLSMFFAAASRQLARIAAPARRYSDAELGLVANRQAGST